MPKAFSESERRNIKRRLMEEAKLCLTQFGVKKTTVDELVKRVNIPKGTFYLFYESKELLFFDVFCEFHDEIQKNLMSEIASVNGAFDAKGLTGLIFKYYKAVEESFLLKLITNGDLELLMRKLPEDVVKAHTEKDDFNIENLISILPGIKLTNIKAISGSLRGIFLSMLHKHEIGDDIFYEALKIMLYGVIIQMFEGESI
ncbi:MAG: TetR family transcriptional regulator [Clostridia bacterium]|jgi:AcrR family transcriptional regulator|nr:TetR family transcriptional regulator [Clostridia bacterium]